MKPSSFQKSLSAALGLFALAAVSGTQAATVITYVDEFHQANGSTAPGTQGYFFGAEPPSSAPSTVSDYSSLTDFSVTGLTGGNRNYAADFQFGESFSTINAPGGSPSINTGILYYDGGAATIDIFTFTVTSSVPSFDVWILHDNIANGGFNKTTGFTIAGDSATASTTSLTIEDDGDPGYAHFTISGDALLGKTFTVSISTTTGFAAYAGGVTFTAVPEPSTVAFLALGGIGMLTLSARRRAAARA